MAFRGTESPMDFEWQGYGPMDSKSPFQQLAMENQKKKRTHTEFQSPVKSSAPALREPNSQPWFFSDAPPMPSPSQYRTPSFTTPRKPSDFDFSSGPESSPAGQADDEETPNNKPVPVEFTAGKVSAKRNSLFGLYGRFAPSPGRGEIKKPASDAIAKRIHKRRRQAQSFEKQLARQRRPTDDTSDDDDDRPSSSDLRTNSKHNTKVQEVGWMTGLFTFIHSYPDAPTIIAKYLQVFFNAAIIGICFYMFWSFYTTIQADVDRASEEAKSEVLAEMAACSRNFIENRCAADTRLPALETVCNNWELCMNRDADAVKRARVSAHTFAEIFNSFCEGISLKTMFVMITTIGLGLFINNATFSLYRRSQEHHPTNEYRHPSGPYVQPDVRMNHFPVTPGANYSQVQNQHLEWDYNHHVLEDQEQKRLEYQQSPSKNYGRSRSRSPEKKKMFIQ